MRRFAKVTALLVVLLGFSTAVPLPSTEATLSPDIADGVSRTALSRASALPGNIDFEPNQEFLFTLPLQVYINSGTGALFVGGPFASSGNGAVLDVSSFRITGHSPPYALAWNSAEGVNADGTIPSLPQYILFRPAVQNFTVNVASNTSAGRIAALLVLDSEYRRVGLDWVVLAPQMQTLTVSSSTQNITLAVLIGPEVMVADDFVFN